jgi:endoglucanase
LRSLAVIAALAAAAGPAGAAPPPGRVSSAASTLAPNWLETAWSEYKKRFIRAGRVVDNVNRISHSEGQGYAMLMAVKAGDRASFDEIWGWTQRELFIEPSGLAAWQWDEKAMPRVTDPNNATDGDMLIAWALLEAGETWRSSDYVDAARRIVTALGKTTVVQSAVGPVLLPGRLGFTSEDQTDGPVINLSYWVFPAFQRLRGIAPEFDWSGIEASGFRLVRNARFGPMRLPAEWTALGGEAPAPAKAFPARFGYNAIRIPLYLVWAKVTDPALLRPFAGLWNETADIGPFEVDLTTGGARETLGGIGFKAVIAAVNCALTRRPVHASLRRVEIGNYYPTTLHILSLVALQERYPECL